MTLWPLYALAALFGLYALKFIIVHLWDETTHMRAGDLEEYLHTITPTDTPFKRRIMQDAQYRKETNEGKDNA